MMQIEVLKQRIEESRQLLYQLGKQYGIRHPKVLKQSMALDELLNSYNRILYKKEPIPIAWSANPAQNG